MRKKENKSDAIQSDEEYWNQFAKTDEEGFKSGLTHDLDVDFSISFKGLNGKVFETREQNINCADLDQWFVSFKKLVRLVDESKSDSIGDGSRGLN